MSSRSLSHCNKLAVFKRENMRNSAETYKTNLNCNKGEHKHRTKAKTHYPTTKHQLLWKGKKPNRESRESPT